MRISVFITFVVLTAATFLGGCVSNQVVETPGETAARLQERVFSIKNRVLAALVHVQPVSEVYTGGKKRKESVFGSGVIISPKGHVVTNYHVAGKAKRVLCTMANQEIVSARLVGGDPLTDIAVLQLDLDEIEGELSYTVLGDSDKLETGEFVVALGSPLALSRSISFGVVSSTDRYFEAERLPTGEQTGLYNTWIQTDAAINPGNSGGPLVNLKGEVIGINARAALFGENLGFAIPSNVVKQVVKTILEKGEVTRSWIGVEFQALQELEEFFQTKKREGVLVAYVSPDSPAERAGIKPGDVILEYNSVPVSARFEEDLPRIARMVAEAPVGSEVALLILRQGRRENITLTTEQLGKLLGEDFECKWWGFTVRGITRQMVLDRKLSDDRGVMVTGVSSGDWFPESELLPGDVIRFVNQTSVKGLEQFKEVYREVVKAKHEKLLLKVVRREEIRLVIVTPDHTGGEEP